MLNFVPRSTDRTAFEKPEGISPILLDLLMQSGIRSREEAERFLHPRLTHLYDPFLLPGIREAADEISRTVEEGGRICVYGDYDVDGVCAVAILEGYLKEAGAAVTHYLPSRHNEGYGLNECAVRSLSETCDLLVTVDCGISSRDLVELAKSLGMRVIVTDHHLPPEALPDCTLVDPHVGGYPFPHLCGAGVAFKLVTALGGLDKALGSIDLAAIATVADVVPLTDENRVIVYYGLKAINSAPRTGIRALCDAAGINGRQVTSSSISFQIAPRLNAGGRLGSACRALDLLTETDPAAARELADTLDSENSARRGIEQKIMAEAFTMLSDYDLSRHRVILLMGDEWNAGVIGLVASRMTEKYSYPSILLTRDGDVATGSCRSIEGVDIYAALDSCSDLLIRFGGHTKAAGLTVAVENVPKLLERLDSWIGETCDPYCFVPRAEYSATLSFDRITPELIDDMELLQPTGYGNLPPVFCAEAEIRDVRAVGPEGQHLKLTLENADRSLPAIRFREGDRSRTLQCGSRHRILFMPRLSNYPVPGSLELELQVLAEEDPETALAQAEKREEGYLRKFLTYVLYNGLKFRPPIRTVSWDTVYGWLTQSPQGTLIAAGSFASVRELLPRLPAVAPDVRFGCLPDDPRGFNTVACCPSAGRAQPFRRIVFTDAVFGSWPDEAEIYRLEGAEAPAWLNELPDLNGMRDACRALLGSRCAYISTLKQLLDVITSRTSLSDTGAFASVKVLKSMQLLRFDHEESRFEIVRGIKKNPEDDEVYRTVCLLRQQFKEDP